MGKRFNFTYIFCDNLQTMEHFYSNILKLTMIWKDESSLAYKIGDHQLSITLEEKVELNPPNFSKQPGWNGGSSSTISWSLECDADDFIEIVNNVREDAQITSWSSKPQWVGYWSFPLMDPMNHTIEITCNDESIEL